MILAVAALLLQYGGLPPVLLAPGSNWVAGL